MPVVETPAGQRAMAWEGENKGMDGRTIVITSGKGGVGKTTVTANLGSVLAQNGCKVCVVDADIGLRNLDVVLGLENRIVYHLVDVIAGRCRLKQALIRDKRNENLYLLPASQSDDKNAVAPEQMRQLCQELKKEVDYILIDCPAGIEQGFRNAIAGADQAIIVTTPEVSAIRDADRIIGLLQAQGIDTQLIINRLNPELVRRGDMLDQQDVMDILAIELLGIVPEDQGIVISTNKGNPAAFSEEYEASKAFWRVGRRIRGEIVPIPNYSDNDNLWSRIGKKLSGTFRRRAL
jgi:septum site-determining protein MinD